MFKVNLKKSWIQETKNLLTDAAGGVGGQSCMTSCSILIMNMLSNRHIYQLRTFVKMFDKKEIKLDS